MQVLAKGGIVEGPPHTEGGVPFILKNTGKHIEEEGMEINIPRELIEDDAIYTFRGTNAEILDDILKIAGLSITDKVTTVKAGDIVICVQSVLDDVVRTLSGTIEQILDKINTSGGCKPIIQPVSSKQLAVGNEQPIISKEGGKLLLAPNGEQSNLNSIQWNLVRTPEFIAWFGDWINSPEEASKVVDENGEPLVVYHGSSNIFFEFYTKDINQLAFFSDNKKVAKDYGKNIIPIFLNIKDLISYDFNGKMWKDDYGNAERLVGLVDSGTYEGLLFENAKDPKDDKKNMDKFPISNIYAIKNNLLAKLADGTNKNFDPNNPDIRKKEGGKIDPEIDNPNSKRWQKKKQAIKELSNNIQRLRLNVSRDIQSDDERTALTALVVAVMDRTAERIGNDDSADNGHFGVTGFREKHVSVVGSRVHLDYVGKKGRKHEKSFSDERIAKALKKAIKNSKSKFIFETSDGFRIKSDKVNRYLEPFHITSKNIRGYLANKWIIEKLKSHKPTETSDKDRLQKERKKIFNKALKETADDVGHEKSTLRKHYMIPELPVEYIEHGRIIDMKNLGYYHEGSKITNENFLNMKIEELTQKNVIYKTPSNLGGSFQVKFIGEKDGKYQYKNISPGWEGTIYSFTKPQVFVEISHNEKFDEGGFIREGDYHIVNYKLHKYDKTYKSGYIKTIWSERTTIPVIIGYKLYGKQGDKKTHLKNLSSKEAEQMLADGLIVSQMKLTPQLHEGGLIAREIRRQIGERALYMLGAHNVAFDGNALLFTIKNSPTVKRIKIELNKKDFYDITFFNWRKKDFSDLRTKTINDVYADQMNAVIEKETGLVTKLEKGGAISGESELTDEPIIEDETENEIEPDVEPQPSTINHQPSEGCGCFFVFIKKENPELVDRLVEEDVNFNSELRAQVDEEYKKWRGGKL